MHYTFNVIVYGSVWREVFVQPQAKNTFNINTALKFVKVHDAFAHLINCKLKAKLLVEIYI